MLDISIVIPVYNNSHSLDELSVRIINTLSSFEFEIIFVNDNSPDDSLDVIKRLSLIYPQIKPCSLPKNIGQHKATLEGVKIATGDKVVVLDGDLQDSPELIPELYKSVTTTSDVVFVKRKGMYQSSGRMITSTLIKRIVQLLSGLHYQAGSYYLFDKSIQPKIIEIGSRCRHPYMSIIIAVLGGELKYIQSYRGKSLGDSGYNFFTRIQAALKAIYCSVYCQYAK